MAKKTGSVKMVLRKLPANQAWAFLYGRTVADAQIIAVGGKRFFDTKEEAIEMARSKGLGADKAGFVYSDGPNPNDPIMKRDPRHLNCGPGGMRMRRGGRHRHATVGDRKRYQIFAGAGSGTAKVVAEYDNREDAFKGAEAHVRCNYVEVYDRGSDHILWSSDKPTTRLK